MHEKQLDFCLDLITSDQWKVKAEVFLPGWATSERNLSSWSLGIPGGCSQTEPVDRLAWSLPQSQTSDDGGLGSNDLDEVCKKNRFI